MVICTSKLIVLDFLLDKHLNDQIQMVVEQSVALDIIQKYILISLPSNEVPKNVFLFASTFNHESVMYLCNQCNAHGIRVPNFILDGTKEAHIDFRFWIELYEKIDNYDGCKLIFTNRQLDLLGYDLILMFRLLTCVVNNNDKDFIDSFEIDMDLYKSYHTSDQCKHHQKDFQKLVELIREYKLKVTFRLTYTADDMGDLSIENLMANKQIGRMNRMLD